MSTLQHQCLAAWLPSAGAETPSGPALDYSSPWPWARALAISITIWLAAAWLIWTLI